MRLVHLIPLFALLACGASEPPPPTTLSVGGPFVLAPDGEGWDLMVADIPLAPDVAALRWDADHVLVKTADRTWWAIEVKSSARSGLTALQNSERWVHGPMSQTGFQATTTQLGIPGRAVLLDVATAVGCLRAGTPADGCGKEG